MFCVRAEVSLKMTGESAHSRPESSSSAADEERELPHVREGWEPEREGEREQEEGEGESRRDQGQFWNYKSFIVPTVKLDQSLIKAKA